MMEIKVEEYVPMHNLGPVAFHENMEAFAKAMVTLGAVDPDSARPVRDIVLVADIERRSIYNRLRRPGFVEVESGLGPATFYYLYNDGFGDLAKEQGHFYYPEHLGPIATTIGRVPRKVSVKGTHRLKGTLDVVGTTSTTVPDAEALFIRALGLEDQHIIDGSLKTAGEKILEVLENPLGKEGTLDNALVLLGGIKRWLEKYNGEYDIEKRTWIKDQLEKK